MTMVVIGLLAVGCLCVLLRRYVRIELVEDVPVFEQKKRSWK